MAMFRSCFFFDIVLMVSICSCRAEDVGVHIPPKGIASVTRHDLERDLLHLLQNKEQWFLKRMRQMSWTDSKISHCFVQDHIDQAKIDVEEERIAKLFFEMELGWKASVEQAAMLSVAKALSACADPVLICRKGEEEQNTSIFFVEPMQQKLEDIDLDNLESNIKNALARDFPCLSSTEP